MAYRFCVDDHGFSTWTSIYIASIAKKSGTVSSLFLHMQKLYIDFVGGVYNNRFYGFQVCIAVVKVRRFLIIICAAIIWSPVMSVSILKKGLFLTFLPCSLCHLKSNSYIFEMIKNSCTISRAGNIFVDFEL